MSFYNFIPSCQICNSRFKGERNFYEQPHIYPYEEDFGDKVFFRTDIIKGDLDKYDIGYLIKESSNFKIDLVNSMDDIEQKQKINNSVKTFKLDKVYQIHKDYVGELITKARIYNESKVKELIGIDDLFESEEEIYRLVFGNYIRTEELSKRPLAKLTRDICKEFGIKL